MEPWNQDGVLSAPRERGLWKSVAAFPTAVKAGGQDLTHLERKVDAISRPNSCLGELEWYLPLQPPSVEQGAVERLVSAQVMNEKVGRSSSVNRVSRKDLKAPQPQLDLSWQATDPEPDMITGVV